MAMRHCNLLSLHVLVVICSYIPEVSALARHALSISPTAAFDYESHGKVVDSQKPQEAYRVGRSGADCDQHDFTDPAPVDGAGAPYWPHSATASHTSFTWRIRIQQPCKAASASVRSSNMKRSFEWDLYGMEFYSESCANAKTALVPEELLASGESNTQFNKELAMDQDPTTKAQIDADDADQVWLGLRFDQTTAVKCVKFIQCDCLRSARSVALEYMVDANSESNWVPLETTLNLTWGEESSLEVD